MGKEFWMTSNSMAKSLDEKFSDYLLKDGYFNWPKIASLRAVIIMILTERGKGKTFGVMIYYLYKRKANIAMIYNSTVQIDIQMPKVLDSLTYANYTEEQLEKLTDEEKEWKEYFSGWKIEERYLVDNEDKKRMYFGSVSGYFNVRGSRSFYPKAIIYDEFNQNVKYAELKNTRAKIKLDQITATLRSRDIAPEHLYMFANKNVPGTPLLGTTIMSDLGITSLRAIGQVAEIYNTLKVDENIVEKYPILGKPILNTIVLNNEYTQEEKMNSMIAMIKDKEKAQWDLDLLLTGDGDGAIFNEDPMDYDDLIINTYRASQIQPNFYQMNLNLYFYLNTVDGKFLQIMRWKNSARYNFHYHVKLLNTRPKNVTKTYVWKHKAGVPYKEGEFIISDIDKHNILREIYTSFISYEDTASRLSFWNEIK